MKGNTKSSRSDVLRPDRHYFWLNILLIITCVCLITSILVISFFIYREIDRSAGKPNDGTKGIHDKYRGDSESTSTVKPSTTIYTWPTKTSTIYVPPLVTDTILNTSTTKMYIFVKTPHRKESETTFRRRTSAPILDTSIPEAEAVTDPESVDHSTDATEVLTKETDIDDSIYFPDDIPLADKEPEKYVDGNMTHSTAATSTISTTSLYPGIYRKAKLSKHDREGEPDRIIKTESGTLAFKPTYSHKNETKVTEPASRSATDVVDTITKEDLVPSPPTEKIDTTIPISIPEAPKSTVSTRYRYTVKTEPEIIKVKTHFVKSSKPKTIPKSSEIDPPVDAAEAEMIPKSIDVDSAPAGRGITPEKAPVTDIITEVRDTHFEKHVAPKEEAASPSPTEEVVTSIPISIPGSSKSPSVPSTISTAATRYRYTVKTEPEIMKMKTHFVKSSKPKTIPKSSEIDPLPLVKAVEPKMITKSVDVDPPPVSDITPEEAPVTDVITEVRTIPKTRDTHFEKYVAPKEDTASRSPTEEITTTPISIPESSKSPSVNSTISTASTRYRHTVKTEPEIMKMKTHFVKSSKPKTIPKSSEIDPPPPVKDVAHRITKSIEIDPPPPSVLDITAEKPAKEEPEPKTIIKYIIKEPPPPIKVCESITCKRSASRMIALMDHNVDPCEDFYSFVCRGIEVNRLKNPQYEDAILAKLENIEPMDGNTKKFKQFVESCRSFNFTEGISRVNQLVYDIFHKSDEGDKRDTLTSIILKILSLGTTKFSFGLLPIFEFIVDRDRSGSFVPTLTIPGMSEHGVVDIECIRNLSITEPDEKNVHDIHEKFNTCRQDMSSNTDKIIHALRTLPSDLTVIGDVDKILANLEKVPKAATKREWNERMLDIHDDPLYFTVKNLNEKYPEINWAILLASLFKEDAPKIEKVHIMFKDYLDKIIQWYRETSLGDLSLTLRLIFTYEIYNEIFVEYDKYDIMDFCLRKAVILMDDLATKLLLTKSNRKDLEVVDEVASDVFSNLKKQFTFSIQNTSWLTDAHKVTILSTLDNLQLTADVNNLWFNDPLLSYRNGKLILTNNYVDNIVILKRNKRSIIYQKINNNPDNVWVYKYNPLSTSVWTILKQNKIILPPGFLMKIAFKKRRSPQQYEIYALLGFQIARGIAAFFDPSQLKRLLAGIEENDVYKNYLHIRLGDPQVAKTINKYEIAASKEDLMLSKNSRFADDLAVRLSMDTYNKTVSSKELQFLWLNYTIPQLFYVALAQDFCKPEDITTDLALQLYEDLSLPNYFRVNSLLMNSIAFSDVYSCPLGSSMNPPFKADAFPHITYTEIDYL